MSRTARGWRSISPSSMSRARRMCSRCSEHRLMRWSISRMNPIRKGSTCCSTTFGAVESAALFHGWPEGYKWILKSLNYKTIMQRCCACCGGRWPCSPAGWQSLAKRYQMNVEQLAGRTAGNQAEQIPISNGKINQNLNAEQLGGQNAA